MRKTTSFTMLISFVLLLLTSLILYIEPSGRVAYWSDWHLLDMSKNEWGNQHITLGFLFLCAGFLHIYYNWKPLLAYLKNKTRQVTLRNPNFAIAVCISFAVCIGTYFHVPPMSTLLAIGESISERGNTKYGEPPYGHAELSSLKLFAKRLDIDLAKAMRLLEEAGMSQVAETDILLDLARDKERTRNNFPIFLVLYSVSCA